MNWWKTFLSWFVPTPTLQTESFKLSRTDWGQAADSERLLEIEDLQYVESLLQMTANLPRYQPPHEELQAKVDKIWAQIEAEDVPKKKKVAKLPVTKLPKKVAKLPVTKLPKKVANSIKKIAAPKKKK